MFMSTCEVESNRSRRILNESNHVLNYSELIIFKDISLDMFDYVLGFGKSITILYRTILKIIFSPQNCDFSIYYVHPCVLTAISKKMEDNPKPSTFRLQIQRMNTLPGKAELGVTATAPNSCTAVVLC